MSEPVNALGLHRAARVLRVPVSQVAAWQRAGLVASGDSFSLRDLAALGKLRDLRQQRLSMRRIRTAVEAMQRLVAGVDPLCDSVPASVGARLVFRYGGALLDPLTQQMGFDFEGGTCRELRLPQQEPTHEQQKHSEGLAQELFYRAVRLEEQPHQLQAAADLYREALAVWPGHAPARINLGTILYNSRDFEAAERHYRAAIEIDPDYALAYFDLGNVLDEMARLQEAIVAYRRAVQLLPRYADAHYNLALAYERTGERRRALRHWMHYVRLDPVGPWATHARMQARRTLAAERLSIVARGGKLA